MRKLLIPFIVLLLASCTTQKPLYYWGKYDTTSYNYLKNSDEASLLELIETYKNIIEKQNGSRGVVPPGIYADYGFLLLQASKTEEGKAMLLKEVALYPESKVFIDRILKMIEK
jgi:hypothetical protein